MAMKGYSTFAKDGLVLFRILVGMCVFYTSAEMQLAYSTVWEREREREREREMLISWCYGMSTLDGLFYAEVSLTDHIYQPFRSDRIWQTA